MRGVLRPLTVPSDVFLYAELSSIVHAAEYSDVNAISIQRKTGDVILLYSETEISTISAVLASMGVRVES